MNLKSTIAALGFWFCLAVAAAQHTPPMRLCQWDDSASFTLEEPAGLNLPKTYFVCRPGTVCLSSVMRRGHPVEFYKIDGDWSCGYYMDSRGGGPVWVRSAELRPVSSDPKPPLRAWVGTWAGGEDRVHISLSGAPGRFKLKGDASWHGAADNVHFGDIAGDAAPEGRQLRFVEDDARGSPSCTIDMTFYGSYIVARDNDLCGALNVRFQGIWKRVPASRKTRR